jgi:thioredoxin-like negative regulator of GroEL
MLLERIVVLALVALLVSGVIVAVRLWTRARLRRLRAAPAAPLWAALSNQPDGRPTVVVFSTPACAVCRSAQTPALQALEQQLGGAAVRILKVDAAQQPDVADAFGVLTVPTTVVLTARGLVATTNNGFAPLERLTEQVQAAWLG